MESPAKIAARSIESFVNGDKSGEVVVGDLKLVVRKIEDGHADFTIKDSEGRPFPEDVWDELSRTIGRGGYSYRYSIAENTIYLSKPEGEGNG